MGSTILRRRCVQVRFRLGRILFCTRVAVSLSPKYLEFDISWCLHQAAHLGPISSVLAHFNKRYEALLARALYQDFLASNYL
jgi:hypothetical protein